MGLVTEAARVLGSEMLSRAARALDRMASRLMGEQPTRAEFDYIAPGDEAGRVLTPEAEKMLVHLAVEEEKAPVRKPLAGSLEARGLRAVR